MKNLFQSTTILLVFLFSMTGLLHAQAPQKMSFQAVVRNASGNLITTTTVGIKISIVQTTPTGTVVYSERHTPTTNVNGLASLDIGTGTVLSGTFAGINWGAGPYYIKNEVDPTGGTTYTITNTSQMMSVPYALYAGSSANGWSTSGNAGTTPGTNFIGTTDDKDIVFKRNNKFAGKIDTFNTSFGDSSLAKNFTSYPYLGFNTSFGNKSLRINTIGSGNTAMGYQSMFKNIDGVNNTAFGMNSLFLNKDGSYNTAIGNEALYNNINGTRNIAIGNQSMYNCYGGIYNTAIGENSLFNVQNGNYNTAIGKDANYTGSSDYITAIGYKSLFSSYGLNNLGIGAFSLFSNTNGNFNLSNGYSALYTNSIGSFNIATGYLSLYSNIASYNNAYGVESNYKNTSGSNNNSYGYRALYWNLSGSYNTAIGNKSLYYNSLGSENIAIGESSLYNNYSGVANTAIGFNSLYNLLSSSRNTAIGAYTGNSVSNIGNFNTLVGAYTVIATTKINSSAIGDGAAIAIDNKVRLGDGGVSVIEGQVAYSSPSDARFKSNIQENVPGLDFIKSLKPVTYKFDTKKYTEHILQELPDSIRMKTMEGKDYTTSSNIIHTGFLAQDIELLCKKMNYDFDGIHIPENKSDNYSVAYTQFIMPLVKGMQEQQVVIEKQNTTIETLKNQNETLEKRLKAIEDLLSKK
jgi:trimeric autotransporter adhesin